MSATLAQIAEELEADAGAATDANATPTGYWSRIANALETLAGETTSANNNVTGYQLRAVRAIETIEGSMGSQEGTSGYLRRLALGLEVAAGTGVGLWLERIRLAVTEADTGGDVPENTELPSISGTPKVAETLTGNVGTWINGPFTYARQWYRDGVAISGATSATYLQTIDDLGADITFGVLASNSEGPALAEAVSAAVGPVEAADDVTAPTITSANPSGDYAEGVLIAGNLTANEAVTWSKSGADAALVTLNTVTGAWSLPTTDFETKAAYAWAFTATDAAGNDTDQNIAISITDVDEGAGIARSAAILSRATAVDEYPPEVDFIRPIDWEDGDQGVMQWSEDPTFVTGVSETASPVTFTLAVTTYNFGLSAILSGSVFMRLTAWSGDRPAAGDLIWSNIVNVGDEVAPTVTSADNFDVDENEPYIHTLTADEGASWALIGGTLADFVTIDDDQLTLEAQDYETTTTGTIQVQPTDYAGNAGAIQTITVTINDVDDEAPTITSTDSVPNTEGVVLNHTLTADEVVTWTIVGGPDQADFELSGATLRWLANGTKSYTGVDDSYSVIVEAEDGAGNTSQQTITVNVAEGADLPLEADWDVIVSAYDTSKLYQAITQTGDLADADSDPVGYVDDASPAGFDMNAAANGNRPLLDITGSIQSLVFDGTDDYLKGAAGTTLGAYAAGSATFALAYRGTPANNAVLVGAGSSVSNNPAYLFRESSTGTMDLEAFIRNDAGTQISITGGIITQGGSHGVYPLDGNYRIIIIVDTGSSITVYVDRVKQTTRTYTRSGTLTLNRFGFMAWVRSASTSFASGELQWGGVLNGYTLTDGGVAAGATAGGEVGDISTYLAAQTQGRSI